MVRNGHVFNQKLSTRIIIVLLLFKNFTTILLYSMPEEMRKGPYTYIINPKQIFFFGQNSEIKLQRSKGDAVVRALASLQCGPGSIPSPGVIHVYGLSLLLVLSLLREVFLRVLGFSPVLINQPNIQSGFS